MLDGAVAERPSLMRDNISGVDVTVDVAVPSLFTRCPVCLPVVAPDEVPLSLTDVAAT